MIEPLTKAHDCKRFDCTENWMVETKDVEDALDMNVFLQHHALEQAKKDISRTFVLRDQNAEEPHKAIAYYSTSVSHLESADIPRVVSPRMVIPVAVLLRLAVDNSYQGKGIGKKLFVHFLHRMVSVGSEIGVYALVLEPLNQRVRGFYERFGLLPLPEDPTRMYVRLRDVRSWLEATE